MEQQAALGPCPWLLWGVLPTVGTALAVVYTGARRAQRLAGALADDQWEQQRRRRQRRRGGVGKPIGPAAAAKAQQQASFPPPPSPSPPPSPLLHGAAAGVYPPPLPLLPVPMLVVPRGVMSRSLAAGLCLGLCALTLLVALHFLFSEELLPLLTLLYVAGACLASAYLVLEEPVALLLDSLIGRALKPRRLSSPATSPAASCLALLLASALLGAWVLTGGHWALSNAIACCVCAAMVAVLQLPGLRVAALCSAALPAYDGLWALGALLLFGGDGGGVHVEVGTAPGGGRASGLGGLASVGWPLVWGNGDGPGGTSAAAVDAASLELPLRLLFPYAAPPALPIAAAAAAAASSYSSQHEQLLQQYQRSLAAAWSTTLGLADMALPGLFLALALRLDGHLRRASRRRWQRHQVTAEPAAPRPRGGDEGREPHPRSYYSYSYSYFGVGLFGYAVGLVLALACTRILAVAQPALIVALPCTLGPILVKAWRAGHLGLLWRGDFDAALPRAAAAAAAAGGGVEKEGPRGLRRGIPTTEAADATALATAKPEGGPAAATAAPAGPFPSSTNLLLLIV